MGSSQDDTILYLAGLYEYWKREDGEIIATYTILTQDSSESLAWLHHRMPVILQGKGESWITEGSLSVSRFGAMLVPAWCERRISDSDARHRTLPHSLSTHTHTARSEYP